MSTLRSRQTWKPWSPEHSSKPTKYDAISSIACSLNFSLEPVVRLNPPTVQSSMTLILLRVVKWTNASRKDLKPCGEENHVGKTISMFLKSQKNVNDKISSHHLVLTLPKTNTAPEKCWLGNYFHIGKPLFFRYSVSFREGITIKKHLKKGFLWVATSINLASMLDVRCLQLFG